MVKPIEDLDSNEDIVQDKPHPSSILITKKISNKQVHPKKISVLNINLKERPTDVDITVRGCAQQAAIIKRKIIQAKIKCTVSLRISPRSNISKPDDNDISQRSFHTSKKTVRHLSFGQRTPYIQPAEKWVPEGSLSRRPFCLIIQEEVPTTLKPFGTKFPNHRAHVTHCPWLNIKEREVTLLTDVKLFSHEQLLYHLRKIFL